MDNTPHIPFFEPLIENLTARDYAVILTVRDTYQTCELADFYKLDYHRVDRHYGQHRIMKIAGTCIRSVQRAHIVRKFTPSLAVAHSSRSLIIVSALLKMPSLQIIDYEHTASAGSAKPTCLMMPDVIRSARQPRHNEKMLMYPGLKEDVYVPRFCADPTIRRQSHVSEQPQLTRRMLAKPSSSGTSLQTLQPPGE